MNLVTAVKFQTSLAIISVTVQLWILGFWVISVYFNIRNTLPKFCPFLLGHPVYYRLVMHGNSNIKFKINNFALKKKKYQMKFPNYTLYH